MPALADLADPLFSSPEAADAAPEVAEPEVAEPAVAEPAVADPAVTQPAPEVAEAAAEPEAAEAAAEVAAEGAVPDVVPAVAAAEPGQTASEQAFADKPTVQAADLDRGTYSPEAYRDACTAAGMPEKWDDRYYNGHTGATQWLQPHDHRNAQTFLLQRGHSASQALKDFLAGPTIADWRVIALAIEIDDVRDTLGDVKFDALFGSKVEADDAQIPVAQRLQITQDLYTTPITDQMKMLAEAKDEALLHPQQPEQPVVAAQVEEKPLEAGATQQPAPELVAEELGVDREREQEHV
ncbi:MAG TPA: hypothetical protein VHT91_04805 [Kofleriaceae bacterium]|jgi:hypothetical protein|nr:hypothetical protein [Kofleriaceae bacterium]